jgi:hypothetical protein
MGEDSRVGCLRGKIETPEELWRIIENLEELRRSQMKSRDVLRILEDFWRHSKGSFVFWKILVDSKKLLSICWRS